MRGKARENAHSGDTKRFNSLSKTQKYQFQRDLVLRGVAVPVDTGMEQVMKAITSSGGGSIRWERGNHISVVLPSGAKELKIRQSRFGLSSLRSMALLGLLKESSTTDDRALFILGKSDWVGNNPLMFAAPRQALNGSGDNAKGSRWYLAVAERDTIISIIEKIVSSDLRQHAMDSFTKMMTRESARSATPDPTHHDEPRQRQSPVKPIPTPPRAEPPTRVEPIGVNPKLRRWYVTLPANVRGIILDVPPGTDTISITRED